MQRRKFITTALSGLLGATALGLAKTQSEAGYFTIYKGYVAGYQYHNGEKIANKIDREKQLALKREPDNPHDKRAIAVYCENKKIGYIAMSDNMPLAALMDNGCQLRATCKAYNTDAETWERVEIKVDMKK
jgi:hypothetical protein